MALTLLTSRLLALACAVLVAVQYAYVFRVVCVCGGTGFLAAPTPLGPQRLWRRACVDSTKGGKPAGSVRDCVAGQGGECTRSQPCTPCGSHTQEGACVPCAASLTRGACFFTPDVGPYCRYADGVRACETCCS